MSLKFKNRVHQIFNRIKREDFNSFLPRTIPIYDDSGKLEGFLQPLTKKTITQHNARLLARWRQENAFAFPSSFKITIAGTKKWIENQVINNQERILFFVTTQDQSKIGHLGLYTFNFRDNSCEVDNVIRGVKKGQRGLMSMALKALLKWTLVELKPSKILLRVFADNERSIEYYCRCGFIKKELIPLKKIISPNSFIWEEDRSLKKADKYFQKMVYRGKLAS